MIERRSSYLVVKETYIYREREREARESVCDRERVRERNSAKRW